MTARQHRPPPPGRRYLQTCGWKWQPGRPGRRDFQRPGTASWYTLDEALVEQERREQRDLARHKTTRLRTPWAAPAAHSEGMGMDHREQPEDLFAWLERNAALTKERGQQAAGLSLPSIESSASTPPPSERKRFDVGAHVRLRWRYRDAQGVERQNAHDGRVVGLLVGHYVVAVGGGVPDCPASRIEAWPTWADIQLSPR